MLALSKHKLFRARKDFGDHFRRGLLVATQCRWKGCYSRARGRLGSDPRATRSNMAAPMSTFCQTLVHRWPTLVTLGPTLLHFSLLEDFPFIVSTRDAEKGRGGDAQQKRGSGRDNKGIRRAGDDRDRKKTRGSPLSSR